MNPLCAPIAQTHSESSREIVDHLARTPLSQIVIFVVVLTVLRVSLYTYLQKTPPHKRIGVFGLARFANEMLDAFVYAGVFVFMLIRPFAVQAFMVPSGSMWPKLYVNDFIVANKAVYRYTDPKPNDIVVFHPPKEGAISPDDLDADGEMKFDFVKRCIGTPGDLIEMKKGVLYRNGNPVEESYKAFSVCTDHNPDPKVPCQTFAMLTADERKQLTLPSFKLVNYNGQIIPLNYTDSDANSPFPSHGIGESQPYHVADKFVIADPLEERKAEALPAERVPKGMYLMMGDNRNNSFDGRGWGLVTRDWIVGRAELVWWPLSQVQKLR
jgi:signal peptidase I